MELSENELHCLSGYLLNGLETLPEDLLEKIEIGVWVFHTLPFKYLSLSVSDSSMEGFLKEPLFLSGRFGPKLSRQILSQFREQLIPYLLIRVRSWECYINCGNEILSEHCDENLEAVREACERLRERCGGEHPTVLR